MASQELNTVNLIDKEGNKVLGQYSGFASWGQVWGFCNGEDTQDGVYEIAQFTTDWVEDSTNEGGGYTPNWTEKDFISLGYKLA